MRIILKKILKDASTGLAVATTGLAYLSAGIIHFIVTGSFMMNYGFGMGCLAFVFPFISTIFWIFIEFKIGELFVFWLVLALVLVTLLQFLLTLVAGKIESSYWDDDYVSTDIEVIDDEVYEED